jgi:ABC transporter substrate binding protein
MHGVRESVVVGGLLSDGTSFPNLFRRAGDYVDKILRGMKPADLPVEQPTKFDLVINLNTAKTLRLTVKSVALDPKRKSGHSRTDMECPAASLNHWGLIFAARITLAHISISAAMRAANSFGVLATTS